jgi:MYXO-CTERM domain-containing protein
VAESAKKIRVITLTRVLCALALAGAAAHYLPMRWFFPSQTTHPAFFQLKAASHTIGSSPFGHPYYRYSVIPGGAYTAEELKTALAHDSVAASHYAGFHVDETRIVTLQSDRVCYVSYRVGDKLYWTRRPITLHKGETLLTDGVHYARTRCGNRVADSPPPQSAAITEPDERAFEAPATIQTAWTTKTPEIDAAPDVPFQIAGNRITGLPEPLANLAKPLIPEPPGDIERDYVPTPHEHEKPPIFATDGSLNASLQPAFFPSETPPVSSVPEPGTAALGGLALIGIALLGRRRMRKHR